VTHRLGLDDGELAAIMKATGNYEVIALGFGPAGVWLEWDDTQPMPRAVELLGLMRGVLNENCEGAGI
jgi:hypothetical protein